MDGRWGRGFTAFEALLACTLLAFIAATVSAALSAGRQQARTAQDMVKASLLARGLIDEIVRLPFVDPQGYNQSLSPNEVTGGRATYDNVADYLGYSDGPRGLGYLTYDASGAQVGTQSYPPEYQGFVRTVTMSAHTAVPPGWGRSTAGLLVTVTVRREGQTLATVQRFVPGT